MLLRLAATFAVACSIAFSSLAWAAGPTDPGTLIDARRKARDDAAQRASVTIDYVLALAHEAKANMSLDKAPGIKEKLDLAATDVMELRKAKGPNDPEVLQLVQRLKDTATEVQAIFNYIHENKLATVKMPADVYVGGD